METLKIKFEEVNYPLNEETINIFGEKYGISMYIIRVHSVYEAFVGIDEKTYKSKYELVDSYTTMVMKIDKSPSKWAATIDGNEYSDDKNRYSNNQIDNIIGICRIIF